MYISRVLCQASSRIVSMHIAFSTVILTWPFKGLIDMVASRNKVFRRWETRAANAAVAVPLSIGIIVESGRDYYLSPFHRRDSGQSIQYRLHSYIVNTACRCFLSRPMSLNLVPPIYILMRSDVTFGSSRRGRFQYTAWTILCISIRLYFCNLIPRVIVFLGAQKWQKNVEINYLIVIK